MAPPRRKRLRLAKGLEGRESCRALTTRHHLWTVKHRDTGETPASPTLPHGPRDTVARVPLPVQWGSLTVTHTKVIFSYY